MRIVIVGIGDIGFGLTKTLMERESHEMVLIELDKDRSNKMANELDALVLNGDGTDPEILEKAKLDEADVLIATTGTDAINTLIAMLGHQYHVEKIIVKLNGEGLRPACQSIGVRKIITPKISAAAEITNVIYGLDKVNFAIVARGGLRMTEINAECCENEKIENLDLPDGAHLVAVQRKDKVLIPRPDLDLKKQDVLYILVEDDEVLEKTRESLSPDRENKAKN